MLFTLTKVIKLARPKIDSDFNGQTHRSHLPIEQRRISVTSSGERIDQNDMVNDESNARSVSEGKTLSLILKHFCGTKSGHYKSFSGSEVQCVCRTERDKVVMNC
jgi:hypothetical protein